MNLQPRQSAIAANRAAVQAAGHKIAQVSGTTAEDLFLALMAKSNEKAEEKERKETGKIILSIMESGRRYTTSEIALLMGDRGGIDNICAALKDMTSTGKIMAFEVGLTRVVYARPSRTCSDNVLAMMHPGVGYMVRDIKAMMPPDTAEGAASNAINTLLNNGKVTRSDTKPVTYTKVKQPPRKLNKKGEPTIKVLLAREGVIPHDEFASIQDIAAKIGRGNKHTSDVLRVMLQKGEVEIKRDGLRKTYRRVMK